MEKSYIQQRFCLHNKLLIFNSDMRGLKESSNPCIYYSFITTLNFDRNLIRVKSKIHRKLRNKIITHSFNEPETLTHHVRISFS